MMTVDIPARGRLHGIRQGLLLAAGLIVGLGLAHMGTSTMPFQIGALVDGFGISNDESGLFGFVEVGSISLALILVSPWVSRYPPFLIAMSGCLITALGGLGLFLVPAFALQLVFGACVGAGFGLVFAATISCAAASPQADRLYAIGNGGGLFIILAAMASVPAVAGYLGKTGIFATLAVLALIAIPFFAGMRRGGEIEKIKLSAVLVPGAPGLLFGWSCFSLGAGGLYVFTERIAQSIHLADTEIAGVLSSGTLVGFLGTSVTAAIGNRINRKLALAGGMIGTAFSCLLIGQAWDLTSYAAGIYLYWLCYMFLYCYLLGTAAVLDKSGRLGTLGSGLERMGYAVGAGLGGILSQHFSFSTTGTMGFIACLLGLAVGFPGVFRVLKARRDAGDALT